MKTVLVTGGAGYIGSHACKQLAAQGYQPVAFDNFSTGWRDAVKFGPLIEGDLCDPSSVQAAFDKCRPDAVLHFAALSQVGESVQQPVRYWRNNAIGSLNLFEAAAERGCKNIILSSTCAIYGDQDGVLLTEDSPQQPNSPYGAMKLAVEHMLRDIAYTADLRYTIFRYFNVAGADTDAEIGEFHQPETHLVPLVLKAFEGKRDSITVHGSDYPTEDGTCVRDYIHVQDLVAAHILGLARLFDGEKSDVFNLGTGQGYSVRQVIDEARRITNRDITVIEGPRRDGDCASLVCGGQKAQKLLNWKPERSDLPMILHDAWRWHQTGFYDH